MRYIVYKYTSPSKKCYIGCTYRPEEVRKKEHSDKEFDFTQIDKFSRAIQHYGFEKLTYEILEVLPTLEEMLEREKYWIKFYDAVESGYNHHEGGTSGNAPKHSDRLIQDVVFMLKEDKLTLQEIANKNNISKSLVWNIKEGNMRNNEVISYTTKSRKGSSNGQSKLTEKEIQQIKDEYKNGATRKELKEKYNVSKTLIQLIVTNKAWNHVQSEYEYKPLVVNGNAKLTKEIVSKLKQDLRNGMRVKDIVIKYNIAEATVYQIKKGKTWRDVE